MASLDSTTTNAVASKMLNWTFKNIYMCRLFDWCTSTVCCWHIRKAAGDTWTSVMKLSAAAFGNAVPGFCTYPALCVAVFVNWWRLLVFLALPSPIGRGGGGQVTISGFSHITSCLKRAFPSSAPTLLSLTNLSNFFTTAFALKACL